MDPNRSLLRSLIVKLLIDNIFIERLGLSEWCTKSDLVLLGHCKITSHQNGIKISMNSNLKLKFDKIYPFNLESERYGYMFKINCDTCRNVVGCLAYDATQAHSINPTLRAG